MQLSLPLTFHNTNKALLLNTCFDPCLAFFNSIDKGQAWVVTCIEKKRFVCVVKSERERQLHVAVRIIIFGASLKRAPQLRVDLAFCHDIYIYIYRPADLCLWSVARRQGRMLRAKSSRRNFVWERSSVLVHACSFTFVFEFVTDRTCQSLAFAFDCQHWTTGQKI